MNLLTPVIVMASLGLLFGIGLAVALKIFGIKVDPAMEKILSLLPGVNCGACGKPGCSGFAEALRKGEVKPSQCVVSNDKAREAISRILGIADASSIKMVAAVCCDGGKRAKDKFVYTGIKRCRAASMVFGGFKACYFGCLGLGDCVRSCPFGAITIGEDNLPVVNLEKCTACGNCVKACPKKLIHLIPATKPFYVKCSSKDPGAAVARVCQVGCIACGKCEKSCPEKAVKVDSFLARISYELCKNVGKCLEVCPRKIIKKR